MRTEEAATYLRISPHTVRRLYQEKRLRGSKNGKILLFDIADLNRFVQEGKNSIPTPEMSKAGMNVLNARAAKRRRR